jgi:hypothetical protein
MFSNAITSWVKFTDYEIRSNENSEHYITPTEKAIGSVYNPMEQIQDIVLDILNIGRCIAFKKLSDENIERAVLNFVRKYGLLGVMTDIPMNDNFIELEETYINKSCFFSAGKAKTTDYLEMFFPFDKKIGERKLNAISIATLTNRDPAFEFVFSVGYSEKMTWFATYCYEMFRYFISCIEYNHVDDNQLNYAHRENINSFYKHKIRYSVTATDKVELVWDFASLKAMIDMYFISNVTGDEQPIKLCKHCGKVFFSTNNRSEFCTPRCRNQWNVYKSRQKSKE